MRNIWQFVLGMAGRVGESHLGLIAAGVAFYGMFAVFPGMAATIALWSLVADPAAIAAYMEVGAELVPHEAWGILSSQVTALLAGPRASLGWTTAFSVFVALYSARAGVAALVQGLNVIHGSAQRSSMRGLFMGYVLTLGLVGVILLALATVVVVPLALAFLPPGALRDWLLSALPWSAMFVMVLTALGMLYRYGPTSGRAQEHLASPGAVLAALTWSGASLAFSYYLANFGTYNRVYGSIGAVIALLMWFYISAYAVLLGAALNAELARWRQKSRS
jgi:membrane protein